MNTNLKYPHDTNTIIFAGAGGSGPQKLTEMSNLGFLKTNIITWVTNDSANKSVERARILNIPCEIMAAFKPENYQQVVKKIERQLWLTIHYNVLSGWEYFARRLDPKRTFNVHPAPLYPGTPKHFGGKGMYGLAPHKLVLQAFHERILTHSEVTMHFINSDKYDGGGVFFRYRVPIYPDDTAEALQARVNKQEHRWQWWVTNLVVNGKISLQPDGTIKFPQGYWEYIAHMASLDNQETLPDPNIFF